jgi:hypothetical protein
MINTSGVPGYSGVPLESGKDNLIINMTKATPEYMEVVRLMFTSKYYRARSSEENKDAQVDGVQGDEDTPHPPVYRLTPVSDQE